MFNSGCIHRKKIASARLTFLSVKRRSYQSHRAIGNVAEKTHRDTNYCGAPSVSPKCHLFRRALEHRDGQLTLMNANGVKDAISDIFSL
jgi:hypothetical protein